MLSFPVLANANTGNTFFASDQSNAKSTWLIGSRLFYKEKN